MTGESGFAARARVRSGGLHLEAGATHSGRDVVVTVSGGERPHIGCVVLAQPHPSGADPARRSATSSVVAIPPHRDEAVARRVAEHLARELGVVVVVAAGVHTDALSPAGIEAYLRLADRLASLLATRLRGSVSSG